MRLEPGKLVGAFCAKSPQGRIIDDTLYLLPQIVEHVVGVVVIAGSHLIRRSATGVDNAAGHRRRAATERPVDDEHSSAVLGCGDGGARSGSTEPNDDDVEVTIWSGHQRLLGHGCRVSWPQ